MTPGRSAKAWSTEEWSVEEYERHIRRFTASRPPDELVSAAMRHVPEALSSSSFMSGYRIEDSIVPVLERSHGHCRAATLWAIHEHAKKGRIRVEAVAMYDRLAKALWGEGNSDEGWVELLAAMPQEGLWEYWREEATSPEQQALRGEVSLPAAETRSPTSSSEQPADPITLEQAARLLDLAKKTLSNRKSDHPCPAPAVPNQGRGPAIWRYSELRPWLLGIWPDRECLLPDDYEEARRRFTST